MKVGASQYHPGLTVRWRGKGEWLLLWCARDRRVLAIVAGAAPSGYAAIIRAGRLVSLVDEPHARRCDAKRAAEVLVGQWWREKCEREALALGRLAGLFGVERKAAAPVQYAFLAEGVEKVTAAFRALADSAKKAGESVRATAGVMPRLNRSPDTDIVVAVRDE